MENLSVNNSQAAERYGKRNLPVPGKKRPKTGNEPTAPSRELVSTPMPEKGRRRPLVRATAPFLAQLSTQYDGVSVLRKARRDRIERAAESYACADSRVIVPATGKQHDFRS